MNRSFFIGVGITILLAIGIILWLLRLHGAETAGYESLIKADKGVITWYKNKIGESVAQATQARVSLEQYKSTHPEEVAQILQEFGIKPSQLQSYLKASFVVRDKGVTVVRTIYVPDTTTVAEGDSIAHASFDVTDRFLTLHGETDTQSGLPWLKVDWEYAYNDTISFVGRVKKNGFLGLGTKTYFVDGKLENPKAQITSLRNVQIADFRDKRFSIGPAVVFDPFSGTVRIGIGISYSLIRF